MAVLAANPNNPVVFFDVTIGGQVAPGGGGGGPGGRERGSAGRRGGIAGLVRARWRSVGASGPQQGAELAALALSLCRRSAA